MKAVRVHNYGGPDVLTYEDVPDPTPGAGQAVVRMEVVGVNFSDTNYRKGGNQSVPLPLVPGHEGIGRIESLGEGVTGFNVGERVVFAGQHRLGTYKELMAIPVTELVPVPSTIDPKLAVA